MGNISRREVIRRMGLLSLSPVVPAALTENSKLPGNKTGDARGLESDAFFDDRIVLQPFGYKNIELLNGSLNRQVEDTIDYYLRIPNDDLLKGFRERAGLPVYGAKDMGGWYSWDFFNIFGQILSGLSRLYAVSGNETCKEKVTALIEGWAACIEPDGYFFYSRKTNAPHYVFDKMAGGLVDANIFTNNQKALDYLGVITGWAIQNLDKNKPYAHFNTEWYTLSENLYRAYEVTKDKKYFDFAQYWEYKEYWDILANNESIFQKNAHYHAYSHLNTLSGAAMAYLLKGEGHYLDTLKNGFDFFQEEQCFATGGYGPDETLLPKEKIVERLRSSRHRSFETQCGTWAVFKLCKYLMSFTGDARYGDWIEKMIYNGAGASIPLAPDGRVFYYSDYNPRKGSKINVQSWSCCSGTRPEDVAEYSNLIYFKNNDGIFVNLYTPSRVKWDQLMLAQETRFPEDDLTTFKINVSGNHPVKAKFHFRKPGWLTGEPEISINNKRIDSKDILVVQNWIVLPGIWRDHDVIKLRFPMNLALSHLDDQGEYPVAITYGPVVMAIRPGDKYPSDLLSGRNSFHDFVPVDGAPLNWRIRSQNDLLVRPFYSYKEGEGYILYVDPIVNNWIPDEDIRLSGKWERVPDEYYYSKEKDASIEADFQGTGIRLHLVGFPNSGKCEVWIDGKVVDTVDEFRRNMAVGFQKDYEGLSNGKHTISVRVSGEKNEKSDDTYINVLMFEKINHH